MVRTWIEILLRPHVFFRTGVTPGDQAPGLTFAVTVVLVAETLRFTTVPDAYPVIGGRPLASAVLVIAVTVVLLTPVVLHLVAALVTGLLAGLTRVANFAPDRGGVSETVQVVAYAAAPCVFAGVPVPEVRAVCALYGALLLVLGLATVHRLSYARAAIVALIPATVVFGYGFRGFAAVATIVG